MKDKLGTLLLSMQFFWTLAFSQTTEVYSGKQRTGIDLMWFKSFKNKNEERTRFLFFSRNRLSVGYTQSGTAFGSTNAISYTFNNGIGLVTVGSFLFTGFTPKTGIQYFKASKNWLFFGWLVSALNPKGSIDLFALIRYQHSLTPKINWFTQMELFPVYQPSSNSLNVTQRFRTGIKHHQWIIGPMLDLNVTGKKKVNTTCNWGGFIRYDF